MQSNQAALKALSAWPIVVVLGLLIAVSATFVVLFVTMSNEGTGAIRQDQMDVESYMDRVEPLLLEADPRRAVGIIYGPEFNCASCHLTEVGLGPSYDDLPRIAMERRPPLQAAAYIYESILFPTAFEVEGAWRANMPINFGDRLTDQQLGDVIAWLLLSPEERPSP